MLCVENEKNFSNIYWLCVCTCTSTYLGLYMYFLNSCLENGPIGPVSKANIWLKKFNHYLMLPVFSLEFLGVFPFGIKEISVHICCQKIHVWYT